MTSTELTVVPFDKQLKLAEAFAQSGLFGIKTKEQALALMALCEAENIHPAKAVMDYHIIQGKPSLKADAMLARFQAAGGKVEWKSYTDEKVTGAFSHPQGGSIEITWDDERVKKAELGGNAMHKKYPRQMKRARVISEAVRSLYPGVTQGLYVPEEVEDFDNKPMKDVTPPKVESAKPAVIAQAPASPETGEVSPHIIAMTDMTEFAKTMAAAVKSSKTEDEMFEWLDMNQPALVSLSEQHPRLSKRLQEVISTQQAQYQPDELSDIPQFIKEQVA